MEVAEIRAKIKEIVSNVTNIPVAEIGPEPKGSGLFFEPKHQYSTEIRRSDPIGAGTFRRADNATISMILSKLSDDENERLGSKPASRK